MSSPSLMYSLHRTQEVHETLDNDGTHANSYFVQGQTADLIIDTGMGLLSLHNHLVSVGLLSNNNTRPLYVVATHEHFDHAGGLRHFVGRSQIMMGRYDADAVINGSDRLTAAVEVRTYANNPAKYWDASPYQLSAFVAALGEYTVQAAVTRRLSTGDTIDVGGGVVFSVVELPGHTPGSIGLHNRVTGELYTGDAMYEASAREPLYDNMPDSDVVAYTATMELIMALQPQVVLPGHFEPLNSTNIARIAKCYIAGPCSIAKNDGTRGS